MKKIIFTALVLLIVNAVNAQGNLQFNQVKHLKYTSKCSSWKFIILASLTVPENKVWKIESGSTYINYSTNGIEIMSKEYCQLLIDKQYIQYGSASNSSLPIWLEAGTYELGFYYDCSNPSEGTCTAAISVLEFNIVP